MLDRAARAVAPGGRLLYATCSSEAEEDEEVVSAFLDSHLEFAAVDPRALPDEVAPGLASVLDAQGRLRTFPHVHGLEAFFAALVERRR